MAQWFCFSCMGYHGTEEEIQKCRATHSRALTPEEIKQALEWVKTHNIIFATDPIDK